MAIIILILVVVILFFVFRKTPFSIKSHPWNHFYDGIQIPPNEFYAQVETGLRDRNIKGLSFGKESFLESHIFSSKREYLRITQAEYIFYVCAAPFGTGTFVSWWLCIKDEGVVAKTKVVNKLAGKDRNNKTFYQMDTEAMYQSAVHSVVTMVADSLTADKGFRLSELDRQFANVAK